MAFLPTLGRNKQNHSIAGASRQRDVANRLAAEQDAKKGRAQFGFLFLLIFRGLHAAKLFAHRVGAPHQTKKTDLDTLVGCA